MEERGRIAVGATRVVRVIAEKRRAEVEQVNAELVHASRFGDELDERGSAPVLEDAIARRGMASRRMDGRPAWRRQGLDREHAAAREEMPRPRRAVRRLDGALQKVRPGCAVLEKRGVHAPLGRMRDASRNGEIGLLDLRRPGRVRGAQRLRVSREEEDAGRLLVEAVDEREAAAFLAQALAQSTEKSARSVHGDAGPLVDGEIRVGPGRRREFHGRRDCAG